MLRAGLSIIGHPAAIAGAILCDVRFNGKLKGDMAEINPTGKYLTKPSLPSPAGVQSSCMYSNGSRLHSSEAIRYVCIALSTSPSAYLSGFAASWASSVASSVRCTVSPCAIPLSMLLRLCDGIFAISSSTFWAKLIASSSSSVPASEQFAISSPLKGFLTSNVSESALKSPPIQAGYIFIVAEFLRK